MGKIEQGASRLNLWSSLAERGVKLAEGLGWEITPAKIINTIWPVVLFVAGMIWQNVPWYVIAPLAVFLAGALLNLFAAWKRVMAVRGVKKLELAHVADACLAVEEKFYEYTEARPQEVADIISIGRPPDGEDWGAFQDQRYLREAEFMRRLKSKIGGEVGAAVALLNAVGIKADSDLRSLHWADAMTRYFGAVGRLLRRGHLEEARKLDPHKLYF